MKKYTMYPRLKEKPSSGMVETDKLVEWVSEETNGQGQPLCCVVPREKVHHFFGREGFKVGKLPYTKQEFLVCSPTSEADIYKDYYGNRVLAVKELFPCFDSHDYLYENRYYRWFYLVIESRLYCVHCRDGQEWVSVTEDVGSLPERSWKKMYDCGLLDENGVLHL